MLKRTLTIGALMIVGLLLVAADPGGEPEPFPTWDTLDRVVYTSDTEEVTILWGTYTASTLARSNIRSHRSIPRSTVNCQREP